MTGSDMPEPIGSGQSWPQRKVRSVTHCRSPYVSSSTASRTPCVVSPSPRCWGLGSLPSHISSLTPRRIPRRGMTSEAGG
jgi:hypothetical protein